MELVIKNRKNGKCYFVLSVNSKVILMRSDNYISHKAISFVVRTIASQMIGINVIDNTKA